MNFKQFFQAGQRSFGVAAASALVVFGGLVNGGAQAAQDDASVSANVIIPIGITATGPLTFGRFSSVAGNVLVSAGSVRTSTAPVLFSGVTPAAATLAVTGDNSATYTIGLPVGTLFVTNTTGAGAETMVIGTWVMAGDGAGISGVTGTLSGAGAQTISVGATLVVGATQVAGSYAGTFPVTVDYN